MQKELFSINNQLNSLSHVTKKWRPSPLLGVILPVSSLFALDSLLLLSLVFFPSFPPPSSFLHCSEMQAANTSILTRYGCCFSHSPVPVSSHAELLARRDINLGDRNSARNWIGSPSLKQPDLCDVSSQYMLLMAIEERKTPIVSLSCSLLSQWYLLTVAFIHLQKQFTGRALHIGVWEELFKHISCRLECVTYQKKSARHYFSTLKQSVIPGRYFSCMVHIKQSQTLLLWNSNVCLSFSKSSSHSLSVFSKSETDNQILEVWKQRSRIIKVEWA